jgi:hypothetical protein
MASKKDKDRKDKDIKATALGERTAATAIRNQTLGFTVGLAASGAVLLLRRRKKARRVGSQR